MKRFVIVCLCIYTFFLTGCDHIGEIENNRVITACFAIKNDTQLIYEFYVSVPTGSEGGEDAGSKSSAKVYEFTATNFADAIKSFEKSGVDKIDLSHISLFVGNEKYYNDFFKEDEKYIRKYITATPLVYSCIYDGKKEDLIDCINKEYTSKAEDFAHNVFSGKNSKISCMLSELVLSSNNKFYTSAIPVMKINKKGDNKLPEIVNICFLTNESGIRKLDKSYCEIFIKWRKKYRTVSDGYRISLKNNKFQIKLNDSSAAIVADAMSKNNIDILNIRHYGKKCFLTYDKYKSFVDNYKLSKTAFESD